MPIFYLNSNAGDEVKTTIIFVPITFIVKRHPPPFNEILGQNS